MNKHIRIAALTALVAFSGITATSALAQTAAPSRADGRWTPYLGCWRLLVENVRNQGIEALIQSAKQNVSMPTMTVCVQPTAASTSTGGVTMTTFADGKKVLEQSIVADGTGHAVSESGCTGTQSSDWSRDGLRLFTKVEMACNNRPKQTISGLTLFAKGPAWVDIQAMQADGDEQVRIRRYVRTLEQPDGLAALPAALTTQAMMDAQSSSIRTLSQEDVTEASSKVASQAVEAAIVESESRFNLNSHALLQLADAGVPPNVIDLMVAQSFPSHFRVERPASAPLAPVSVAALPPTILGGPGAGYPYYSPYDPFGYYSYYYSPFAYPYYWGNSYYSNYPRYYINNGGSSVIIVDPNYAGSGGNAQHSTQGRGQVVNGQGYTRVHSSGEADPVESNPNSHPVTSAPRTVRAADPSASSPSTSQPTTSSTSSSGSSGSSGSSSSGSSGGVSQGGYSNGGGGDTGRTAQPR